MLGIVLVLKLPTILLLAWAFLRPAGGVRARQRYRVVFFVAAVHVLLALLSFSGEKSSLAEMFVAYPLIWSVLLREPLRRLVPVPAPLWLRAVVILLFLWLEETWVIVDFHSPPLRHYVHYFGFYAGMTATIIGLYTRYRYTVLQTFVVGGLWGVLVEQQWKGPKLLLSGTIVEALTFALYIFPVYGLYLAAPRLLFFEEFNGSVRSSRWQGLWLFLGITILPLASWLAWSAILQMLGFDKSGVP